MKIRVSWTGFIFSIVPALGLAVAGVAATQLRSVKGWGLAGLSWWLGTMILIMGVLHSVVLLRKTTVIASGEKLDFDSISYLQVNKSAIGYHPKIRYRTTEGLRNTVALLGFWCLSADQANRIASALADFLGTDVQLWSDDPEPEEVIPRRAL